MIRIAPEAPAANVCAVALARTALAAVIPGEADLEAIWRDFFQGNGTIAALRLPDVAALSLAFAATFVTFVAAIVDDTAGAIAASTARWSRGRMGYQAK